MQDKNRSKKELIDELSVLRRQAKNLNTLKDKLKQSEESMQECKRLHNLLLDTISQGIQECDISGTITFFNTAFCRIIGYNRDELSGRKIWDFFDSEEESKRLQAYFSTIPSEQPPPSPYSSKIRTKDGRAVTLQIFWNYKLDQRGNLVGFVSVITDITKQKQVEEKLLIQYSVTKILNESANIDETLTRILQIICESIGWEIGEVWNVDTDTNVLRLNSMWHLPLFDVTEFEAISKKITFTPGKGLPGIVWANKQPHWILDVVTDTNFPRSPVAAKIGIHGAFAFPVRSSNNVIGVLTFFSRNTQTPDNDLLEMFDALGSQIGDFIERKRAETEILKMHKLESIGILANGIAHDFNNMLTAILGNISLSKRYLSPDEKVYSRLTDAEDACMEAKELSYRLLTFSKGGEPFRKKTIISDILKETVTLSLSGSSITSEFVIPDNLYPVEIDRDQIDEVLRNIVTNAREAMPEGGTLKVYAKNITDTENDRLPLKDSNYMKISIEDSGIGIPEENLSKVFDPYFTTKEMGAERGTGLGLAICYSIIKRHEGFLTVESRTGMGTTFHIYLPASEKKTTGIKGNEVKPLTIRGRILVMDDERFIRDVTGNILKHLEYGVEFARNGDEAVELYKKAKGSGEPFDIVILDLTVHGGMGGEIAMKRLLEFDPEVKGIASSGYVTDPIMTDFREYGFAGAILKPYNLQELGETLDKLQMEKGR